jgi:hypothetical protein
MKMEQTECSETLAYKIQTPGNYPGESIQQSEHGESLKSRTENMIKHFAPNADHSQHEVCNLRGQSRLMPSSIT